MAVESLFVGAQVVTSDPPGLIDGQSVPLSVNVDQRLRVSTKPGAFATASGDLTSVGGVVVCDVTDASNVMIHLKNSGTVTMTAGVLQFEGSLDSTNGTDGTWFPVQAVRSNANTIETAGTMASTAAGAGFAYAWEISVNACRWFRVRVSTAVTTNAIATVSIVRGSYATEPIPAVQTHPVTGSGNFTVVPGSGTNFNTIGAATTNATNVKSSAGSLTEISVFNPTAALIYVKLYNKASAPTVGTDVPTVTIPVPVNGLVSLEFGQLGKRFSTGIGFAITTGPLATDTTAPTAGIQIHGTFI